MQIFGPDLTGFWLGFAKLGYFTEWSHSNLHKKSLGPRGWVQAITCACLRSIFGPYRVLCACSCKVKSKSQQRCSHIFRTDLFLQHGLTFSRSARLKEQKSCINFKHTIHIAHLLYNPRSMSVIIDLDGWSIFYIIINYVNVLNYNYQIMDPLKYISKFSRLRISNMKKFMILKVISQFFCSNLNALYTHHRMSDMMCKKPDI